MKQERGFSLIELSIILAVMGILMAGLLSSNLVNRDKRSLNHTTRDIGEVIAALKIFYQQKGYLPCPASGTAQPNTATFGKSTNCNTPASAGVTDITPPGGVATDAIRIGVLPTRSLSLPDDYMYDEWGNRLTYVVIKKLAASKGEFNGYSTLLDNGVIEIKDETDTVISTSAAFDPVAYLLVSHGKTGKGAYTKYGVLKDCSLTGELDGNNCDSNASFMDSAITDNYSGMPSYYDDVVVWEPRSKIMASKVTSSSSSSSGASSSGGSSSTYGYFVLVSQTINPAYTGDKGGLAGGNDQCLEALTTYEWKDKADADSRGLLTASKVKWFNCDTTTCQLPVPNTTYQMAVAGDPGGATADRITVGGHQFTTDAWGRGPGDTQSWTTSSTFDTDQGNIMSNVSVVGGSGGTLWDTVPKYTDPAKICNNYTSSSSAIPQSTADWDSSAGPQGRFEGNYSASDTTHMCGSKRAFICIVNP